MKKHETGRFICEKIAALQVREHSPGLAEMRFAWENLGGKRARAGVGNCPSEFLGVKRITGESFFPGLVCLDFLKLHFDDLCPTFILHLVHAAAIIYWISICINYRVPNKELGRWEMAFWGVCVLLLGSLICLDLGFFYPHVNSSCQIRACSGVCTQSGARNRGAVPERCLKDEIPGWFELEGA